METNINTDTNVNKSVIEFLDGKNVFIFDTETTGLPQRVPGGKWGTASEYWDYSMNEKYNQSRVVSIAWVLMQSFEKAKCLDIHSDAIINYIRYPEGFDEIPTTHIHGISFETAIRTGIPFSEIFNNCKLYDNLMSADYIIAHNVNFDIHILLNEIYRLSVNCDGNGNGNILLGKSGSDLSNAKAAIKHILNLMATGKCICTGEISKDICKLEYKYYTSKYSNSNIKNISVVNNTLTNAKKAKIFKMPKLIELYNYFYKCDFDNAHSAEGDVKALLQCLAKM